LVHQRSGASALALNVTALWAHSGFSIHYYR